VGHDRYDVAIVGAGLVGSAAARELTGRGHSVLVLEQHYVGHDRGSSHGSSRIFRRAYGDAVYVALTGRAEDEWARLEEESGVTLRTRTGGLDAGPDRPQNIHDALRANRVEATMLEASAVAERWPGITLDTPACFHPEAGHLDADLTVTTLLDLAAREGARLREHTPMTLIEPVADGLLVHTDTGTDRVGTVVVAAGAWLPELLGGLGVTPQLPPVQVRQVEVFHHRHRDPEACWPTLVHEDDIQVYCLASGRDGGPQPAYKIGQFDSDSTTTASSRDGLIDDRSRRATRSFVERQLPGLDPDALAEQSCLFTMTADEDFVLDRAAARGGEVVIASPCSGHGAKFAPLTGVLVADLVEGAPPHPRFAFRTGRVVDGRA
jgi:monomeric sarcosine oxidase